MNIQKYLEGIHKYSCPNLCDLRNNAMTKPVIVSLPSSEIIGILISRDPTYAWYQNVYEYNKDPFIEGIPGRIINKIEIFMNKKLLDEEKGLIKKTLYKNIYWTHLHKCYTDQKDKSIPKFKNSNAKCCADKWLSEELITVIKEYRIKFIIALGNEVQKWIKKWVKDHMLLLKDIEVINLLHTSDKNNIIWYRSAIKIIEDTEISLYTLARLCK